MSALWGCTETCLLNGECAPDQVCLEGDCRLTCSADRDCPSEQFCFGGGCRGLVAGEVPPCRDDAGCADAEVDAAPPGDMGVEPFDMALVDLGASVDRGPSADLAIDGGVSDFDGVPDAEPTDAGLSDGDLDGEPLDGDLLDGDLPDGDLLDGDLDGGLPDVFLVDGGVGVDLGGLYAVTSTVVVATGGDLSAGDVIHRIHRLVLLGGSRYRIEVFDTEGEPVLTAEADFAAPEGQDRYQFEYTLPLPAPDGCLGAEVRFQRGNYAAAPAGSRLMAAEERTIRYDGDDCPAGHLVRLDVVWSPLPDPE